MNVDTSPVERAQRRFFGALDALEAAVRRHKENERSKEALEAELRTLGEDRSRLAQELDRSQARAVKLEAVVGDVSGRLDTAIGTIRGLLEQGAGRSRSGNTEPAG
ncbi:DUF4164 domain-containing protein [Microbaculum marinum]|uniref:DUF4164 domain-containing protein n=1 Tax=Microbaculum marinum TaxID=1764581 RepID=A0AAW9RP00_9HYPH